MTILSDEAVLNILEAVLAPVIQRLERIESRLSALERPVSAHDCVECSGTGIILGFEATGAVAGCTVCFYCLGKKWTA